MPGAIAACFRCAPAAAPLASGSTAVGPSLATSVYETHLGLVALSWSRTSLGLSLRAVLRLSSPPTPASSSASGAGYFDEDPEEETLAFRVSPWLLWRRRGSRRFSAGDRRVRGHRTWVNVRGKEREISVDLVSRDRGRDRGSREKDKEVVGLSISVDGERLLHVRRLRWKFRGSERVDLGGGDRVQVSWDLHNWLFPPREPPLADAAAHAHAHAVFVFRFELGGGEEREEEEGKDLLDKASGRNTGIWRGYFARWGQRDWSETGSNGERKKNGRGRRLAKASSSSSASVASSTASWASGSTVMDWASPEEAEMQRGDGFSLLVYAWKR